jgi:predicted CXXCH cytochrome family protein
MKKPVVIAILAVVSAFLLFGCSRTWQYVRIEDYKPKTAASSAEVCKNCHQGQYDSWKDNRHSSGKHMARIPVQELRECEGCHSGTDAHASNPTAIVPPRIKKLSKTEQNTICGKCHYNQELFGGYAINPHDKHGLYKSVGFEGHEQQLSCLECHSGHEGGSEMLVWSRFHICYKCHKGAIATMGIFQPINYLAFGKACQGCHAVHGESTTARWTRMGVGVCVVCHFVGVALTN